MKKIFYAVLILGLISCRTQKESNEGINTKIKKENFFSNIQKKADFSTLKIKASAKIESGNTNYPAVALTLFLDNGKQIWANASVAFFMIARADISPSGFKMYEKPGKTYINSDFNYVNSLLKIDFLNYNSIENLLLGKLFFPVQYSEYTISFDKDLYILTSNTPLQISTGKNSRKFNRKLTYNPDFNLKQVILEDISSNTYLQIDYDGYVKFENSFLPKSIKIFIKEKKESKISIDYNKFEFVKMDTPFEIPKGYTQRDIK